MTLVVTGGIASGKSTVCSMLLDQWPSGGRLFDADACVHEQLTTPEVIAMVIREFGESVLGSDGKLSRPALRRRVFSEPGAREALEMILHPVVRQRCLEWMNTGEEGREAPLRLLDIPLFYESQFEVAHDHVVLVATDGATQMKRLLQRPGVDCDTAEKIIHAQMPTSEKLERADHVVWNSGGQASLERQCDSLVRHLSQPTP